MSPVLGEGPCNFTTGANCNVGGQLGVGLFSYGQQAGVNGLVASAPAWAAPGSASGVLWDLDGFNLFPLGAGGTQYTLVDSVIVNGSAKTYTAAATLKNPPTVLAVSTLAYAANGTTGGGTFTFGAPPAGVTEQVAVVLTGGVGTSGVLTMAEAVSPATTAVLPAGTLTPGTPYTCFVMAADFPWVEAGAVNAPTVGTPTPVIVGANGNADLSVSATTTCTG